MSGRWYRASQQPRSFSLQPSATANYWQQLMAYGTPADPSMYNMNYGVFGPAGRHDPPLSCPRAPQRG